MMFEGHLKDFTAGIKRPCMKDYLQHIFKAPSKLTIFTEVLLD